MKRRKHRVEANIINISGDSVALSGDFGERTGVKNRRAAVPCHAQAMRDVAYRFFQRKWFEMADDGNALAKLNQLRAARASRPAGAAQLK